MYATFNYKFTEENTWFHQSFSLELHSLVAIAEKNNQVQGRENQNCQSIVRKNYMKPKLPQDICIINYNYKHFLD